MDLVLFFLISKIDFKKLSLEEILVEWGGEKFSQEPPKFQYQSTLTFTKYEERNYFHRIVGDLVDVNDYFIIKLEGEALTQLAFYVNKEIKIKTNPLISFLYELYSVVDTFCIIKFLYEDVIDDRYTVSNAEKAINIFVNSLKWDSPKGIVIIKI